MSNIKELKSLLETPTKEVYRQVSEKKIITRLGVGANLEQPVKEALAILKAKDNIK